MGKGEKKKGEGREPARKVWGGSAVREEGGLTPRLRRKEMVWGGNLKEGEVKEVGTGRNGTGPELRVK